MNKEILIEDFLNQPIKIGDLVTVRGLGIKNKNIWGTSTNVEKVDVDGKTIYIKEHNSLKKVGESDYKKSTYHIGYNPFNDYKPQIKNVSYDLEGILSHLNLLNDKRPIYHIKGVELKYCNFNPFIFIKNEKYFYQREFVWNEEQCKNLIQSLYNDIDCGKIIVRERSWESLEVMIKNGETEASFNDIVDGKQRLIAIHKFINNEYPDHNGIFYKDFSNYAKNRFFNHQNITFSVMSDECNDEDVLTQFLKVNFSGVLQSTEHINYIKELLNKFK